MITSSRNLFVAIYSIESSSFNEWRKKYDSYPSEILCLNEKIPSLSRISFPNSFNNKDPYKRYILLELYLDTNILNADLIEKCRNYLSPLNCFF